MRTLQITSILSPAYKCITIYITSILMYYKSVDSPFHVALWSCRERFTSQILWRGVRVVSSSGCACVVTSGGCRASVWLSRGFRRLVALLPSLPPGPLYSGLPQSSLPVGTPQLSLLQELSTAVIRVHCGAAISQSSLSCSSVAISNILSLSLPAPLTAAG